MKFYSRDGFRPIFLYWPYKSPTRIQFNDMQPRFTLANQGIEKFLERENKKKKKWSFG